MSARRLFMSARRLSTRAIGGAGGGGAASDATGVGFRARVLSLRVRRMCSALGGKQVAVPPAPKLPKPPRAPKTGGGGGEDKIHKTAETGDSRQTAGARPLARARPPGAYSLEL